MISQMNNDRVEVVWRGKGPFEVDRQELAARIRDGNTIASSLKKRPGEALGGKFGKNSGLSADALVTGDLILSTPQER